MRLSQLMTSLFLWAPRFLKNRRRSVKIIFDENRISYISNGIVKWEAIINEITAIGYATTDATLWADDFFFLFNVKNTMGLKTFSLSLDLEGVHELISYLGKRNGFAKSSVGIANATTPKSIVIWPLDKQGQPFPSFSTPRLE